MKIVMMQKFIIVLLIALLISSAVSGMIINNVLLQNTKEKLCIILEMLDRTLDYTGDLQAQIGKTQEYDYSIEKDVRLTIMTMDGNVLADNSIEGILKLENHKDREECENAREYGIGYAVRDSATLNTSMLYAAMVSENKEYFLRAAIPYHDGWGYIRMLFPALFIGFSIAMIISTLFAAQFSKSILNPLQEIYIKKMELEKRIRQEFFSNASHELKTPITSIQGYAELLENGMVESEEMKGKILSRIRKETENMTELINDILMISKLETKDTQVMMVKVRMAVLIEELVIDLIPTAKEESVTLTWESEPLTITANPQQMKELVSNLVTNAIKYNKPGGNVHISVREVQDEMELSVRDTGIGIMQIDMERIFERFYRANKGRSKKVNGTGLGLSIVKHIVNFYEGKIQVQSEPEKGTTFIVHIPLERIKENV